MVRKKTGRPAGRPAKGAAARTATCSTKVTLEERARFRLAAERLQRSESDLLREWMLGRLCELG